LPHVELHIVGRPIDDETKLGVYFHYEPAGLPMTLSRIEPLYLPVRQPAQVCLDRVLVIACSIPDCRYHRQQGIGTAVRSMHRDNRPPKLQPIIEPVVEHGSYCVEPR